MNWIRTTRPNLCTPLVGVSHGVPRTDAFELPGGQEQGVERLGLLLMNGDRSVLARILVSECVVNLRQDLEDADKAVPELWSMPVPRTALSAC